MVRPNAAVLTIALSFSLLLATTPAPGVVLPEGSDAQKHRRDIGKQVAKYVQCLVKAAQKCERNGDEADQECFLASGTVQGSDPNLDQVDFQERIAKCDSKLNLSKKSPSDGLDQVADYQGIGCPGDSNSGTAGDQPFTGPNALNDFQTAVKSASKTQIDALSAILCALGCAQDCTDDSEVNRECLLNDSKRLSKYAKGTTKCRDKCEKDYKVPDSAGGGGPTDNQNICTITGTGAPNFDVCTVKPTQKLAEKASSGASTTIRGLVDTALDDASNDLFNECDCGSGVGPCP